jgi:hypothetical protein
LSSEVERCRGRRLPGSVNFFEAKDTPLFIQELDFFH